MRSLLYNAVHLGLIGLYVFSFFYEPFIEPVYLFFGDLTEGIFLIGFCLVCYVPYFYMERIEEKREFREMTQRINKRNKFYKRKKRKKKK